MLLRSHRISHLVVSWLRQSHSTTFSWPGFRPSFTFVFGLRRRYGKKNKDTNQYQIAGPLICMCVQSPIATATHLFTGMHSLNLGSFFAKSWPTNRTMYSNVHLDIIKFSFHNSSTKFPFNRVSNQNWFLGLDHARLTRLFLRRVICSRINRFRLDLFRCCKVRAATISIPGFADPEQENKTRGLQHSIRLWLMTDLP